MILTVLLYFLESIKHCLTQSRYNHIASILNGFMKRHLFQMSIALASSEQGKIYPDVRRVGMLPQSYPTQPNQAQSH